MLRYCPTCNASSDDVRFIGEFCENCVKEKISKGIPDCATLEVCKSCGRIRTHEGYVQASRPAIKDALSLSLGVKWNISVNDFDWKKANLTFRKEYEGEEVAIPKDISIKIKKTMCTDCYRRTSGYFEATVQLRGKPEKVERVMGKLLKFIEARNAFVSRVDELDNGYDIYVSDKTIANAFFEYYELKPGRSYTLHGVKHGKKLYRNTYILRLEGAD
ncbi:MAG: 60S ribosomal export protein NMD3 [Candidatus Marsarchaeota archaeon]|nr:60S ribosomal export protein NMD3 [Candidatus Marsarchaeota archaeon]MCL5115346.1 60S ribosomal export protein NMD3 [Candidatus Marsarchaeota archaeon]